MALGSLIHQAGFCLKASSLHQKFRPDSIYRFWQAVSTSFRILQTSLSLSGSAPVATAYVGKSPDQRMLFYPGPTSENFTLTSDPVSSCSPTIHAYPTHYPHDQVRCLIPARYHARSFRLNFTVSSDDYCRDEQSSSLLNYLIKIFRRERVLVRPTIHTLPLVREAPKEGDSLRGGRGLDQGYSNVTGAVNTIHTHRLWSFRGHALLPDVAVHQHSR